LERPIQRLPDYSLDPLAWCDLRGGKHLVANEENNLLRRSLVACNRRKFKYVPAALIGCAFQSCAVHREPCGLALKLNPFNRKVGRRLVTEVDANCSGELANI
jgi:hypothetical protein